MIADDYVAALQPWLTTDLETYARALAGMWAQVEQYAADPDETDRPSVFVYRPNLIPNPGFEYDTIGSAPAGWVSGLGTIALGGSVTTFQVAGDWSARGAHSCRLTGSAPVGQTIYMKPAGAVTTYPATRPGDVWAGRCVVNVLSANTQPELRIFWYDSTQTLITTTNALGTTTTGVQTVELVSGIAPAGAAYGVVAAYLVNRDVATATVDAEFDMFIYQNGSPADPQFTGDDPGFRWLGVPGDSVSAPVAPLPPVGWSIMLDPDVAPVKGLPYLAQWAGERLPIGIAETDARRWIKNAPNQSRGTLQAIVNGIFPFLTGTKTVYTKERVKLDGTVSSDWLSVITFASETPNTLPVTSSFRRTAPNDINIDYQAATTATWAGIEASWSTWSAVAAANATWIAAEALTAGTIPPGFTRWMP